jgi:hypothetical protein
MRGLLSRPVSRRVKLPFKVKESVCPQPAAKIELQKRVSVEKIPDEALVVRGGRNLPADIVRGTGTHPSGVTGISVESAVRVSVAELAASIPHGQVGVTTVGEVHKARFAPRAVISASNSWPSPSSISESFVAAKLATSSEGDTDRTTDVDAAE